MDMFENKVINGIHVSRYIASWTRAGGTLDRKGITAFLTWLKFMGLSEEDARYIRNFAENGKLELQEHAKIFMRTMM